jgi:hypothetical protein
MENMWMNFLSFGRCLRWILKNSKILFCDLGQYRTMRTHRPIDANGEPLPWYTYPMIEYLKSFNFSDKVVYEWGCGNSSTFWANRCKKVISCEHNKYWFDYMMSIKRDNQDILLFTDQESYVKAIEKSGEIFDIIIIDGEYRNQCAGLAPQFLRNGGFIILDNSDWYPSTSEFLREQGFFQIDFSGFGPVNNYTWTTSMFIRCNQIFQKKGSYLGPRPIGGIEVNTNRTQDKEN